MDYLVIAVRDLAHLAESGIRGVEGVAELKDFDLWVGEMGVVSG